ncbi:MAG TPA: GAF domain-containing protein [Arthrobacter sp.]|jgi:GAF domain-containing protein
MNRPRRNPDPSRSIAGGHHVTSGSTVWAPGIEDTAQRFEELLGTIRILAHGQGRGLDPVLERVIRSGCLLVRARSGILGLFGNDHVLRKFIAAGIEEDGEEEQAARIGPMRAGRESLDLLDIDPKALKPQDPQGFPNNLRNPEQEPPMKSLLEVPITADNDVLGTIYWIDKIDGEEFTADDEEAAVALASAAGIAIKDSLRDEEIPRRAAWLDACLDVSAYIAGNDLQA